MKLQAVHDGRVYAIDGRRVYRETSDLSFEPIGTLPVQTGGTDRVRTYLTTSNPWKRCLEWVVGSHQTANVWVFSPRTLLATVDRRVLVSHDGGNSWQASLHLPHSSVRMGVLPSGVCRHDGVVYLGEYPLDEDARPRVYRSFDDGASWETYAELPGVRHVLAVTADPYSGDIWVTTGDSGDACRLLRFRGDEMTLVGGGSQEWRIVEPAFTEDAILWGVDCGYAAENQLFKLPRDRVGDPSPAPERVGVLPSSVYYSQTFVHGETEHVFFSTAAERGPDRTAPQAGTARDRTAEVVTASSDSEFADWTTVARYRRRSTLVDRLGDGAPLPTANAYVLLGACPDRGLFLNPINTATDDGRIRRVSPRRFVDEPIRL